MNCAQRLIYNGLNAGRTAALFASSVLPADRTIRSLPAYRGGSAALALTGAYTGEADATFDVEIVDATPTTPIISQPLLTGVGNGALSAISFAGTAQKFTLELVDAGLPTLFAAVAFAGVNIVARASGAAGNGIALTVNSSGLTYTPLPFSLIAPLPKDTRKSDAVGLDFNAALMAADNQFPATAKRITFGPDKTQVYRQAKKWTGAKWEYLFEPPIQAYQPAATRVSEVSGTYTVTVVQGATTETFTGIKTNYDLLLKLNTLSALVRIDGVIANDRAADGQAAGDLSMRTDAYALPAVGSGSFTASNVVLQDVVIAAGAPTEIIELKCWASTSRDSPNAHLGAEIWSVKGSVTGAVGNFKTGDTIAPASGAWSLVIPAAYPIGYGDSRGEFSVRSIDTVARTSPAVAPPICVVSMALGPDAVDQTVALTYTKRPSGDCACDAMSAPDLSNSDCLMGPNNPNSPGASSVSYPSTITAKMTALWDWRADVSAAYTDDHAESTGEKQRLDAALLIATLLEKTAVKVNADSAALLLWDTLFADVQAQYATPFPFTAGEALAAGDWVQAIGQKVFKATGNDSTSFTVSHWSGRVSAAFSAGAAITTAQFVVSGAVTGLSGLTPGATYAISNTVPGTLRPHVAGVDNGVGVALNATVLVAVDIYVNPYETFFIYSDRFQTRCDAILASAGISPLGKSDASTVSDDGCWQDLEGEAYYWAIEGSTRGAYLPAFNNTPYFSSRTVARHSAATHEFAFQLNILCPDRLKEGDRITLAIGNAGWSPTYQVGDAIAVSVVAAAPQTLAGGQNGNANQTWHVSGDAHGPFAVFTAAGGSGSYSNGGLAFTLAQGAIPFEKGSRFAFSAEGGHWRWRKNAGAWSGSLDIGLTATLLANGISATFAPGVAPSFNVADVYKFAVRQPNAPSNVQAPTPFAWRWSGASATLDIDMGTATAFDALAIARHTLPTGASLTVSAGSTQGASDVLAATALTVQPRTIAKLWDVPIAARWVRLALTSASGGSIGWLSIAQAFRPSLAAEVTPRLDYAMDRGNGINPSSTLLGRGRGCSIDWRGSILESDYTVLATMIDWVKANGDEPILFFPSPTRADDSYIGKVSDDSTELQEVTGLQAMSTAERRYSAKIGLTAIMQ